MAGIGFELKRLFNKKSALGYFKAYFYSMVVTVGPFVMMTGLVLLFQAILKSHASYAQVELYIISMVYPFIFSQIISSGFVMLITRFISDRIYSNNLDEVMPSLIGMLAMVLPLAAIFAILFLWKGTIPFKLKLVTYILYMELIAIWIQGVYLSALKDYMKIIKSYFCGAVTALGLFILFLYTDFFADKIFGALLAMDVGFFVMAVLLMLNIRLFFPAGNKKFFSFIPYLDTHFSIFLVNLFYTIGLYIPNIIIWQGPWGVSIANSYVYAPNYDMATFYAFLSILPISVVFVVFTELAFYEKYTNYVTMITDRGNYKEIEDARKDMFQVLWSQICNLIEIQLAVSLVFLALGNYILPKAGLDYASINVYNLLVLGAFSNAILQIIIILLLYFEDRRGALYTAAIFLFSNAGLNYISLFLGENSYGFGFFLSALISLIYSLLRLNYYSRRIDYYIYCSIPVFNTVKTGFFFNLKLLLQKWFSREIAKNLDVTINKKISN